MRYTREKYSSIKVPQKYRKIISNLKRKENIIVMKQDKGKCVFLTEKYIYTEKCLASLDANQLTKLNDHATKIMKLKYIELCGKKNMSLAFRNTKHINKLVQMWKDFTVQRESTKSHKRGQLMYKQYDQ